MKLSKEELKTKVNGLEIDDEVKISLLEDIEDSFVEGTEENTVSAEELETIKQKYEDLKERYKARFFDSDSEKEEEKPEELEEKEIVDIKEI